MGVIQRGGVGVAGEKKRQGGGVGREGVVPLAGLGRHLQYIE